MQYMSKFLGSYTGSFELIPVIAWKSGIKKNPLETTVPFEFAPKERFQAFSKYKQVSFLPDT